MADITMQGLTWLGKFDASSLLNSFSNTQTTISQRMDAISASMLTPQTNMEKWMASISKLPSVVTASFVGSMDILKGVSKTAAGVAGHIEKMRELADVTKNAGLSTDVLNEKIALYMEQASKVGGKNVASSLITQLGKLSPSDFAQMFVTMREAGLLESEKIAESFATAIQKRPEIARELAKMIGAGTEQGAEAYASSMMKMLEGGDKGATAAAMKIAEKATSSFGDVSLRRGEKALAVIAASEKADALAAKMAKGFVKSATEGLEVRSAKAEKVEEAPSKSMFPPSKGMFGSLSRLFGPFAGLARSFGGMSASIIATLGPLALMGKMLWPVVKLAEVLLKPLFLPIQESLAKLMLRAAPFVREWIPAVQRGMLTVIPVIEWITKSFMDFGRMIWKMEIHKIFISLIPIVRSVANAIKDLVLSLNEMGILKPIIMLMGAFWVASKFGRIILITTAITGLIYVLDKMKILKPVIVMLTAFWAIGKALTIMMGLQKAVMAAYTVVLAIWTGVKKLSTGATIASTYAIVKETAAITTSTIGKGAAVTATLALAGANKALAASNLEVATTAGIAGGSMATSMFGDSVKLGFFAKLWIFIKKSAWGILTLGGLVTWLVKSFSSFRLAFNLGRVVGVIRTIGLAVVRIGPAIVWIGSMFLKLGPILAVVWHGIIAIGAAIAGIVSGPVLLIVGIVAAIALAGYLVWKYWDNITQGFKDAYNAIKECIHGIGIWISSLLNFKRIAKNIADPFINTWHWITGSSPGVIPALKNLEKVSDRTMVRMRDKSGDATSALGTMYNVIEEVAKKLAEPLQPVIEWLLGKEPEVPDIKPNGMSSPFSVSVSPVDLAAISVGTIAVEVRSPKGVIVESDNVIVDLQKDSKETVKLLTNILSKIDISSLASNIDKYGKEAVKALSGISTGVAIPEPVAIIEGIDPNVEEAAEEG